jgi:hypothetical protein
MVKRVLGKDIMHKQIQDSGVEELSFLAFGETFLSWRYLMGGQLG